MDGVVAQNGSHGRLEVLRRVAGAATGRIVDTVDPDLILDHVDVDALVQRVDVDALVQRVDVDALIQRVDVDALIQRVDVDALVQRVDVGALVESVDVDALVQTVDVDALVSKVDVDALVQQVDVETVVAKLDVDALVQRIDVDALIRRVDVDALIGRVDIDALLERADMERVLARVDVAALVARSGVPDIISSSTGQMAQSGLDLVRRQVAGLDLVAGRLSDRLLRRRPRASDGAPTRLARAEQDGSPRRTVTGHYAGAVSRLLAFLVDLGLMSAVYTGTLAAVGYLLNLFLGVTLDHVPPAWGVLLSAVWGFTYVSACVLVAGRTPGKALLGLRIVRADGDVVPPARTLLRAVLWVASVPVAVVAVVPVVLGRRHRAVHDVIAGTAVVHDWGDRPAELPAPLSAFLDRSALARPPDEPVAGPAT